MATILAKKYLENRKWLCQHTIFSSLVDALQFGEYTTLPQHTPLPGADVDKLQVSSLVQYRTVLFGRKCMSSQICHPTVQ